VRKWGLSVIFPMAAMTTEIIPRCACSARFFGGERGKTLSR
jgi:hypothetical protein